MPGLKQLLRNPLMDDWKREVAAGGLQRTLATLEAEIQTVRRHYNGCVCRLNTKIASVPGNIVARRFGFELAAYYEVEHAADRTRPEVSF